MELQCEGQKLRNILAHGLLLPIALLVQGGYCITLFCGATCIQNYTPTKRSYTCGKVIAIRHDEESQVVHLGTLQLGATDI